MEKQTVRDDFRRMAYGVFEGQKGWKRQKSDLALEVAGKYAVSAMRFTERLLEKIDIHTARTWLEDCLKKSVDFQDASTRLRLHIDTQFKPEELVLIVRGMLVAVDGDYAVESSLQDLPCAPAKPWASAAYYRRDGGSFA